MRLHQLIICEDVRGEADNRHSLMGVFGRSVLLTRTTGPIVLPRIGFYASFEYLKEETNSQLIFQLWINEKKLLDVGPLELSKSTDDSHDVIWGQAAFTAHNLFLGEFGKFSVKLIHAGMLVGSQVLDITEANLPSPHVKM